MQLLNVQTGQADSNTDKLELLVTKLNTKTTELILCKNELKGRKFQLLPLSEAELAHKDTRKTRLMVGLSAAFIIGVATGILATFGAVKLSIEMGKALEGREVNQLDMPLVNQYRGFIVSAPFRL